MKELKKEKKEEEWFTHSEARAADKVYLPTLLANDVYTRFRNSVSAFLLFYWSIVSRGAVPRVTGRHKSAS
jgi:hypothetical protein